jgi:4,5-DOPA dioxygenase extradiol
MKDAQPDGRMPVIFIGHGSPENAIGLNEYNQNWKLLGEVMPKPRSIVCISAHWLIQEGTAVTAMDQPKTIHDFYGFPPELYRVSYPAKGSKETADLVQRTVKSVVVEPDTEWGLDHGCWSVLKNMYPDADIPVVQLSLNYNLPLEKHHAIGKELATLRDKGILIIGSGNIVHNLTMINRSGKPHPWALDFDKYIQDNLAQSDHDAIIHYIQNKSAQLAHPTNEHYLPLLYVIGASGKEKPQFFNEGMQYGSISMRSVVYGMKKLKF